MQAGITTTLNARASILAAANPLYGRYNPKRSPRENINLPPALLSRFDLLFLILDTPNHDTDTRLAEHVCHVHRTGQPLIRDDAGGDAGMGIVTPDVFRRYIAEAKKLAPLIPEQLVEYIVSAYTSLRAGMRPCLLLFTTRRPASKGRKLHYRPDTACHSASIPGLGTLPHCIFIVRPSCICATLSAKRMSMRRYV